MRSSNHALTVERITPRPPYEQTPATALEPQQGARPAAPRLVRRADALGRHETVFTD